MSENIQKLPAWKILMHSLGSFGWSLASFSAMNALIYFYMPPEASETHFPSYIFQGKILGIATIIGLIGAWGRVLSAFAEPWIANRSDRTKTRWGRRRLYMSISLIPFIIFSFLVFFPLVPRESNLNALWLFVCITIFYFAVTMYGNPLYALISELGHSPKERLNITTAMSIAGALGFALGSQVYLFRGILSSHFNLDSVSAFQTSIVLLSVIAFVAMLMPLIFINERKYCKSNVSEEKLFAAIRSVFKNKEFVKFTLGNMIYWLPFTIILDGINFFIMTLLQLKEGVISNLLLLLIVLSFLFYIPVNLIAKRTGKKKLIIFAFIIFIIDFIYIAFLNKIPLPPMVQAYIMVAIAAIPIAIFGILPPAIISDIAESDGISTGSYKEALFFGTNGFVQKIGMSIGNFLVPSFLLLGKSVENPTGIRMVAIAAFLFCILGLFLYIRYDEKKVLEILATKENID